MTTTNVQLLPYPEYRDNADIYEHFNRPTKELFFGGELYQYQRTERKGDVSTYFYRCKSERHTLRIHLQGSVVYFVDDQYSIGEIV